MKRLLSPLFLPIACSLLCALGVRAELWMPSIFSDHMVLQRAQANPVWGAAEPGATVTVSIGNQHHEATACAEGNWRVHLEALPAGGPHQLRVSAGNELIFEDVLIGEVWFCTGQSNMAWPVRRANEAAIEIASANHPQMRLIKVPHVGTQTPQRDFEGAWMVCAPETVADFSAVGYLFGRRIHDALGVPVGMVDLSWGGSAAEAWVPRERLEPFEKYDSYLKRSDHRVEGYTDAFHATRVADWQAAVAAWEASGREGREPRYPRDPRYDNKRPGNIFNGVVHPVLGYGLRGMLWYQGEENASRNQTYAHLSALVIENFRERWGQGTFPFYWVQLASFRARNPEPEDTRWARLREQQTATLDLVENGAQAVIIDAGEALDIHPGDKHTVANRLARIALARDYGFDVPYQSARYAAMTVADGRVTLTFEHMEARSFQTIDVPQPMGFALAGEDRVFHWAEARIVGENDDQIEVWSEAVADPVAVRFGWADNPAFNLFDNAGLPVTPFRTDDW